MVWKLTTKYDVTDFKPAEGLISVKFSPSNLGIEYKVEHYQDLQLTEGKTPEETIAEYEPTARQMLLGSLPDEYLGLYD